MRGIAQYILSILSFFYFTIQYFSIVALKSPANYTASIENVFHISARQSALFLVDNWRLPFAAVNPSIMRIDYNTEVISTPFESIKKTQSLILNITQKNSTANNTMGASDMLLVWRQPKVLHKFRSPSKIMYAFLDNTKKNMLGAINEIQFMKKSKDGGNEDSREDARVIQYNQTYYIIYNKFPVNGNKIPNTMSYAKLVIDQKKRSVYFTTECEIDIEHGVGGKKRIQKNWTPFTYKAIMLMYVYQLCTFISIYQFTEGIYA